LAYGIFEGNRDLVYLFPFGKGFRIFRRGFKKDGFFKQSEGNREGLFNSFPKLGWEAGWLFNTRV